VVGSLIAGLELNEDIGHVVARDAQRFHQSFTRSRSTALALLGDRKLGRGQ
jgi:hypothetical protein